MLLSSEQLAELEKFPVALQALVHAELAAGNLITEIGHSFPAPPAGAYFKLANKVTTCARSSSDGLEFYERNSSLYSGEFSDSKRFYFVIEPANPPPKELDMDAIRSSLAPAPVNTAGKLRIQPAAVVPDSLDASTNVMKKARDRHADDLGYQTNPASSDHGIENHTRDGASRTLYFQDVRSPLEVLFSLERRLCRLFSKKMEGGKLCFHASATVVGATYQLQMRFEAALPTINYYSLTMHVSWAEQSSSNFDYYSKTSHGWFDFWTRDFQASRPPLANEIDSQRYRQLCEATLQAQEHQDTVEGIQQSIISELKKGATFRTSHKEGGTKIFWTSERFVRDDYGDDPAAQQFTDEVEFLRMLRQFCYMDVTRNSGNEELSELDLWRLVFRQMDRPSERIA